LVSIWLCLYGPTVHAQKDLPYRIDPARTPKPEADTLVLWRFEEVATNDTSASRNHGKTRGKPSISESGRYGKCVQFSGGEDAFYTTDVRGFDNSRWGENWDGLTFDFWCRIEGPPPSTQCLLEFGSTKAGTMFRLGLNERRRLVLSVKSGDDLLTTVAQEAAPAKEWFHIGLHGRLVYQPNRIYTDQSGIEILLDGFPHLRAYHGFARPQVPAALALGNALTFDKGFVGLIDEFRLTDSNRQFCRLIRQDWLDPDAKREIRRPPACFKAPQSVLHYSSFDSEQERSRVEPPAKPLSTSESSEARRAATEAVDTDIDAGPEDTELELGEDEAAGEIERSAEGALPLGATSGVRGQAIVVRGGEAKIDLPENADLTAGTVEFWIKPGDWDNVTVKPNEWREGFTFNDSVLHLLTLYGVPREGEGDPVPLVSLRVSRLAAKVPVTDEFEKHFPSRPRVAVEPHQWTHVACHWGKGAAYAGAIYFDGQWMGKATRANAAVWGTHRLAFVRFGNVKETAFDELRVYPYPFSREEIHNSIAEHKGEALRKLGQVPDVPQLVQSIDGLKIDANVREFSYLYPLGEVKIKAETPLHRFSGWWKKNWMSGVSTKGRVNVFFGYRLSVGKLLVGLTNAEGASRAEVEFPMLHAGRAANGTIPAFEDGKGGTILDVGLLPEGDHPLRGTLYGADGAKRATFSSTFRRMPLPWLHNKLGLPDTPPPPFEPITVDEQTVTAVGRRYTVAQDGNLRSIEVRDEEILAAPIRFEVEAGGKVSVLEAEDAMSFGQCSPVEANWHAAAVGSGLIVRSKVTFEYDGMARYDLDISPTGGQVSLDRLSLQIPLKAKYAQLAHMLPVGGRFRAYVTATFLPAGQGPIWDSRTWGSGKPIHKQAGSFVSNIWLGDMLRGLVWFADNDRGWVPNNNQPAAAISRNDGVVTLALHFISENFVLEEPRQITYGLMATPPKPLTKDHRLWNRGHTPKVGAIGGRLTSCDAFAPWEVPVVDRRRSAFAYWPPNDDWEFARMAAARQRVCGHNKYPPGVALMLYHDKDHCPVHPEGLPYFGWIWRCCSYPQSRVDNLIWYMDKWIASGMDGVYIDDVFPNADWNMHPIGTAYILPGGQKKPGIENFRYRQYLKRLYALLHQRGKRPIITTHMTSTLVWPFHSFVAVIFDCEEAGRFRDPTVTYMDAWPLDRFMTIDIAERTGIVTVPMLKGVYVTETGRSPQQQYETRRSYMAMHLLFDHSLPMRVPAKGAEGHKLYDAVARRYYGTDIEVHPFWRNEHMVTVEPLVKQPVTEDQLPKARYWVNKDFRASIAKQPLRATIYKKGNRSLLILANFLRASVGARVRLDFDALGVPKESRAAIRVSDLDDWPSPPKPVDRTAPPPPVDETPGLAEGDDGADDEFDVGELEPEEPKKEDGDKKEQFPDLDLTDGVLSLKVRGHDFRIVELIW